MTILTLHTQNIHPSHNQCPSWIMHRYSSMNRHHRRRQCSSLAQLPAIASPHSLNVSQNQRLHACSSLHAKLEVMCRMCLWAVHHCKSVAHMLGAFEQVFPHGLFLENQVFGNQLNLSMQMQTNTTTSANRVSPIWTRFSLSISDFNINISDQCNIHLDQTKHNNFWHHTTKESKFVKEFHHVQIWRKCK